MFLNTLDVKLTVRKETDDYRVVYNDATLDILKLIFEFKIATGSHISRFISKKGTSRYIYMKLRRMWQAGLLESFKIFSDSLVGASLYYMLSKEGLEVLRDYAHLDTRLLKNYPKAKTLLDWGLFKHEAQVVELASLEALNDSSNLTISFKGEDSSKAYGYFSDKSLEILTPDYTVFYQQPGKPEQSIYTEFERTIKSKKAILKKVDRYYSYLTYPQLKLNKTLRIIFETKKMETNFWLALYTETKSSILRYVAIYTTNLSLIKQHHDFFGEIYATDSTVEFVKTPHLNMEVTGRRKMFGGAWFRG